MYRKEVNEHSPMRIFERSMRGGLGKGNVGVIAARPGIGKTAFLVQIALDVLLRDQKVLHISHEHAVDRVRAFYDELFHDIVITYALAGPQAVRLELERNRLIYSHLEAARDSPPSLRGGTSSVGRIQETIDFAKQCAGFTPDVLIIDGFDFHNATSEAVDELTKLAKALDAEVWLSAKTDEYTDVEPGSSGPGVTPEPIASFFDQVAVIVLLQPDEDGVRLELLKEHDNPDVSDLSLRLDPTSMRVRDEDLPPRAATPKDPARYTLISGATRGAEAYFGECAEEWGLGERHYSFEGHHYRQRERGLMVLDDEALKKGDFSLVYASHRLGRPLSEIPYIKRILQTVWHQITNASEVFVVGELHESGIVRGGTGWGAELARLWSKPVCVFDQKAGKWFRWDATHWRHEPEPTIQYSNFAGIGTMRLSDAGKEAIRGVFERSFGPR